MQAVGNQNKLKMRKTTVMDFSIKPTVIMQMIILRCCRKNILSAPADSY